MQPFRHTFDSFLPRIRGWHVHIISALAVLFVAGLLIGAFFFFSRPQSQGTAGGKHRTMLVLSTQKDGLQLSATITPGPYFLREMLGVDLSLKNHTQNTIYVGVPFTRNLCGYFSGLMVSGGNDPSYQLPISLDHSCPAGFRGAAVQSGKSITVRTYEPLLSSGLLTLTVEIGFFRQPDNTKVGRFALQAIDPFDGHWPTAQIQVSSSVPPERQIVLTQDGEHVRVDGPREAQSDLVYAYSLTCGSVATGDMTITGNYAWEKFAGTSISPPQDSYCAGKRITWTYVFAASGYALVSGTLYYT